MAKKEIAYHEHFHLWPQCFQKSSAAIVSNVSAGDTYDKSAADDIDSKCAEILTTFFCHNASISWLLQMSQNMSVGRTRLRWKESYFYRNFDVQLVVEEARKAVDQVYTQNPGHHLKIKHNMIRRALYKGRFACFKIFI